MQFGFGIFLLRFTPYQAEQQYQGIELQEKEKDKDEKHRKAVSKEPKNKKSRLILGLKPFRS